MNDPSLGNAPTGQTRDDDRSKGNKKNKTETRPRPGCFYDEVTKMRVCPFASVLINISHDVNN